MPQLIEMFNGLRYLPVGITPNPAETKSPSGDFTIYFVDANGPKDNEGKFIDETPKVAIVPHPRRWGSFLINTTAFKTRTLDTDKLREAYRGVENADQIDRIKSVSLHQGLAGFEQAVRINLSIGEALGFQQAADRFNQVRADQLKRRQQTFQPVTAS